LRGPANRGAKFQRQGLAAQRALSHRSHLREHRHRMRRARLRRRRLIDSQLVRRLLLGRCVHLPLWLCAIFAGLGTSALRHALLRRDHDRLVRWTEAGVPRNPVASAVRHQRFVSCSPSAKVHRSLVPHGCRLRRITRAREAERGPKENDRYFHPSFRGDFSRVNFVSGRVSPCLYIWVSTEVYRVYEISPEQRDLWWR